VKFLVRESCVEVVNIEFLLQKVEISVRESCVEVVGAEQSVCVQYYYCNTIVTIYYCASSQKLLTIIK
jgi:hypothetical protein